MRWRVYLLACALLLVLGTDTGTQSTGGVRGFVDSGGAQQPAQELHDAIDATCTGWDLTREEVDNVSCDAGNARIDVSSTGSAREAILLFNAAGKPTNTAQDTTQKALVTALTQGQIDSARIGFVFGGDPDDCLGNGSGTVAIYKNRTAWGGKLSMEAKCWGGTDIDAADDTINCVDTGAALALTPDDFLIVQIDGTLGNNALVNAWVKTTDPCPTSNCNSTDLGAPDAVIDTATECGTIPAQWITSGDTAGFYILADGTNDFELDGDYAVFQVPEAQPFSALGVALDESNPTAFEGSAPANVTVTVSNEGTTGIVNATLAESSLQDCKPVSGPPDTTWADMVTGVVLGVTPTVDKTDAISFAGATDCEPGTYTGDVVVTCVSPAPADCEGTSPTTVPFSMTINPTSTLVSVSPNPVTASMTVDTAAPSNTTATISNPGSTGTHSGTIALEGAVPNCNPSGTANTGWISLVDTTWTGVSTVASDTAAVSWAGADDVGQECDEGNHEATARFTCTGGDACDNSPLDVTYRLTVAPPPSASGSSARCVEMGAGCFCSEPYNVDASLQGIIIGDPDRNYDPPDSVTKECHVSGRSMRFLNGGSNLSTFVSAASVGLPAGNTLTSVFQVTTDQGGATRWDQAGGTVIDWTDKTFCLRYYHRVDPAAPIMGTSEDDIKGFELPEIGAGTFAGSRYKFASGSKKTGVWRFSGGPEYDPTPASVNVGQTDCANNWCIEQFCQDHNWDGSDRVRVRGRVSTIQGTLKTQEWLQDSTNTNPTATYDGTSRRILFQRYHTDCGDETPPTGCAPGESAGFWRRWTHLDVFVVDDAQTQASDGVDREFWWPGPACEVEGGC